jgi:amidase
MDVFQVQRAINLRLLGEGLDKSVPNWRQHAKDTALWNIDKGRELTTDEILLAETKRSEIYSEATRFFEKYDALILPAAQVPPFDHQIAWIAEIEGVNLETYIDWMTVCCAITVTGFPAISVPAGFTKEGLPVGVQIVGKPRGDLDLLRLAGAFEQETEYHKIKPNITAA